MVKIMEPIMGSIMATLNDPNTQFGTKPWTICGNTVTTTPQSRTIGYREISHNTKNSTTLIPTPELRNTREKRSTTAHWKDGGNTLTTKQYILHILRALVPLARQQPAPQDRKSTRLNSSHIQKSRMPSSA